MKKSDRLKIVVLGIIGLLILIGTGIFIFIGQSICTMAGVGLFVIVCLGMVAVAGKKDDQTETIEQLNQTISEQSRRKLKNLMKTTSAMSPCGNAPTESWQNSSPAPTF